MANNIIQKTKEKFGLLLFHLVDCGFSCAQIEQTIIHSPFFLCFENNDADAFLDTPIEDIIERVFRKKTQIDHLKEVATEIFWAGQMYISLLVNEGVPIQRSLVVCPILKMVSWFNPYHEMDEGHLCKRYLDEEENTSVLKALMEGETNVRKLADLTQINIHTLRSYLINEKLFAASFSNVYALSFALRVPLPLFAKRSSFRPIVPSLLNDERFLNLLVSRIASFFGIPSELLDVKLETPENTEIRASTSSGKRVLDLFQNVIYRKGNKPLVIKEEEVRFFYALAADDLKKELETGSIF